MSRSISLLVFEVNKQSYALHFPVVEKIIRAVAVTALPRKPEVVLGVISVHGRIIPVVDLRKRFQLPERDMHLSDQMIIARTTRRTLALLVDGTNGIVELSADEVAAAEEIVPNLGCIEGVGRLDDRIILIHDLDRFLSLEEEQVLDASLG